MMSRYNLNSLLLTALLVSWIMAAGCDSGGPESCGRADILPKKAEIKKPAPPVWKYGDSTLNASDTAAKPSEAEEALGIRLLAVRLSAGGNMLDMRYVVIDSKKAEQVLVGTMKPEILDEKTGGRYTVPNTPTVGSLKQVTRAPKANRVYFALFANPGKSLKKGSNVSVVFGDQKIENVKIE